AARRNPAEHGLAAHQAALEAAHEAEAAQEAAVAPTALLLLASIRALRPARELDAEEALAERRVLDAHRDLAPAAHDGERAQDEAQRVDRERRRVPADELVLPAGYQRVVAEAAHVHVGAADQHAHLHVQRAGRGPRLLAVRHAHADDEDGVGAERVVHARDGLLVAAEADQGILLWASQLARDLHRLPHCEGRPDRAEHA